MGYDVVFPESELKFPYVLRHVWDHYTFKVAHGGRGGLKSHNFAQALLAKGTQTSLRILCCREIQKTLAESSMQLLEDWIKRLHYEDYYEVLKNEIRSRLNDTLFKFTGLREHTAHSIKSYEGFDIAWVEEAAPVRTRSWNLLIPTILRKKGSEIWVSFNPDDEDDYCYTRWVKPGWDKRAIVMRSGWRDAKRCGWWTEEMEIERLQTRELNEDLYQHIYEGKCRTAAGLLFKRKWFKRFKLGTQPKRMMLYMSSDYAVTDKDKVDKGHPPDFTEFGIFGIDENGDIWIIDWYYGQVDPRVWIAAAVKLLAKHGIKIWFEESGVIRRSQESAITRILNKKRHYVHREGLASAGSKAERALGFMALASMGHVYIPRGVPWAERLINQLCSFTGQDGRTDDGVDVCSLFSRGLDFVAEAARKPGKRKRIIPFTKEWLEANEEGEDDAERKREFYGT